MRLRTWIGSLIVLTGIAGATGFGLAREPYDEGGVTFQQLFAEAMAREPGKEVNAQVYTFPPGSVLPWHIHPDAHEIAYVVEGDFTFQLEGEPEKQLKVGEATYLRPNVVHRGMNKSDKPVRLFVVRIKPKDAPLVVNVPAPPQ